MITTIDAKDIPSDGAFLHKLAFTTAEASSSNGNKVFQMEYEIGSVDFGGEYFTTLPKATPIDGGNLGFCI